MAITTQEIEKVALLARLRLSPKEVEALANDMSNILNYVETLSQVDVSSVEDAKTAENTANVFRADEPVTPLPRAEALRNAPRHTDEFFLAPKVIG